ncbi:MAG: FAD-containing monooxygenase EthA [Geminicoccaceae bacterium]|jgi:cation diffusion facilitator CzcD-associated flavoprotein CzcO|nr:FAD-containing monooxygenase EthA [Geminicoccaceae bacterium]
MLLRGSFGRACRARESRGRRHLLGAGAHDGDETHFTPAYRPWRQRIAFIPDGDLFQGIRREGPGRD